MGAAGEGNERVFMLGKRGFMGFSDLIQNIQSACAGNGPCSDTILSSLLIKYRHQRLRSILLSLRQAPRLGLGPLVKRETWWKRNILGFLTIRGLNAFENSA